MVRTPAFCVQHPASHFSYGPSEVLGVIFVVADDRRNGVVSSELVLLVSTRWLNSRAHCGAS